MARNAPPGTLRRGVHRLSRCIALEAQRFNVQVELAEAAELIEAWHPDV